MFQNEAENETFLLTRGPQFQIERPEGPGCPAPDTAVTMGTWEGRSLTGAPRELWGGVLGWPRKPRHALRPVILLLEHVRTLTTSILARAGPAGHWHPLPQRVPLAVTMRVGTGLPAEGVP